MPTKHTKAELETRIESLENDVRRMSRALGQAHIDLDITVTQAHTYPTPAISEHAIRAIKRAKAELDLVVKEPSSRISVYIGDNVNKSTQGLGWTWLDPYTRNGQFAWCGAFAAFAHTEVRAQIRKKIFPSCYRLYSNWSNTSRHIDPSKVQAGDIVVIYTSKRSVQGDHITLCIDTSTIAEGYIKTIEGNAHGTLGDGTQGEGVITRERTTDEIAHVYRLLAGDFDE
tara:strand:- start:2545 stop:3228 length:684 start_codon:yes stop_codon:yes gene_type:complete